MFVLQLGGMKMRFNSDEIQNIIPHRFPFLLIDNIIEMEVGKFAISKKNISISDPVFQGHFPGESIYPGVLIIEAMAQVGAVAILSQEENKGKKAYFTKIKEAKFLKAVRPGDSLIIKTELISKRLNIGFAKSVAKVDNIIVAKSEMAFALEK